MDNKEEKNVWHQEETYARISRRVIVNLADRLITPDEFLVFVWLSFNANPYNGMVTTSYSGLASDLSLSGVNANNKINKIMLNLKKKRYIWYGRMQGRKGNFRVAIADYMLANGGIKNIYPFFEVESSEEVGIKRRKILADLLTDYEKTTKDVPSILQKSNANTGVASIGSNSLVAGTESRSTNNDTDNDKEIENKKEKLTNSFLTASDSFVGRDGIATCGEEVTNFIPKDVFEEQLKKIATDLGEKDMKYLLSAYRKYGLTRIIDANRETIRHPRYNEPGFRRGAYLNSVLTGR